MAAHALHSNLFRATTSASTLIPLTRRSYQAPIVCIGRRDERPQRQTNAEMPLDSCSNDMWSSLSVFLDGEQGVPTDSSESLLGFSASLFSDKDASVMSKEDPPKYIPAPIQKAEDLELSKQLEDVLYMLREVLPGPMCKIGMDNKLLEAWRLVHKDIKFQDPVVCLEGKDKLFAWLHMLASAKPQVNLHDIYAETSIAQPCKNGIHAIWTLSIPGELLSISKASRFEGLENTPELSLSGDSKFELDRTGQVVSVESNWYARKGEEGILETIKKCLFFLLHTANK